MEGWRTTTLGDLFAIGSSKRVTQSQWQSSGVPFYRGREITALGELGHVDNELFISEALYSDYSSKYGVPAPGDIMLTAIGTIGNSYVVRPGDRFYFKDASVLWMANKGAIDSAFVNHWLKSDAFREQLDVGNGATVDTLTIQKLKSIRLSCPADRSMQRRIVVILDEAFEAIASAKANTEKNLQNARDAFESYLESSFLREEGLLRSTKLGHAFRTLTGTTPSKSNAAYFGDFMPLVKPPELVDGVVDGAADGLSRSGAAVSRVLPVGSVMVSCIGNLGKVGINSIPVACNQQINAILPDEAKALPEFMFYQALARPFKRQLENSASGTTVPIVNKSRFNDIYIVLPSLNHQQEIVDSLRELRAECVRLAALCERKLAALDELKNSILHQAFTGQLTAKVADQQLEAVA